MNHKEIEKKWNNKWFEENLYAAEDFSEKPKKYILVEFPYPSGQGLHCGHVMRFTIPDVYARKLRMSGYNVLFPIGWDAFGLPAENYAVKTGVHPAITTQQAIETYRRQMREVGFGFDWKREINTTDPNYYKWTQWLFLKFWENGLAELKEESVWWSEKLKTVLANEEVYKNENGELVAERDDSPVERKMVKQWVLKIPQYADKLLEGLDEIDFPQSIKSAQRNWIGRSDGINITYDVLGSDQRITCFTTTPVNFGATFIAVAPEYKDIDKLITNEYRAEAEEYINQAKQKTEVQRMIEEKNKTGVFTGSYALNHVTKEQIPIWIADFVIASVGTGALQGCPGHDMRDFEFAKKYNIPIKRVVVGEDGDTSPIERPEQVIEKGMKGTMVNSDFLNGLDFKEAMQKTMDYFEKKGWGECVVNYKLRDWLFSRQRYWGEPIPLIHRQNGEVEAVCDTARDCIEENKLPLLLPEVPDYTPSSDALSPLAKNEDWVNTVDSQGNPAKRETNTMPNWAGSSWYYMRYLDPNNNEEFASSEKMEYWLPVDQYFGGSEHTTLHLLYSRFWHRFFYDLGLVPTKEPYKWRMNGGVLLGPDGKRQSKSRGNIINPDEKVQLYGADALRLYINFMGPYDATIAWQEGGIKACKKFLDEICYLKSKVSVDPSDAKVVSAYHKMVKRVTDMVDNLKMNTAVSEFMIFVNLAKKESSINQDIWKGFLKLLAPFAPFITEELWQEMNNFPEWKNENSIHLQSWPEYDENLVKEDMVKIGVQVNGKLRGEIEISPGEEEESIREKVFSTPEIQKWISSGEVKKFIYVKGKIVNVVV